MEGDAAVNSSPGPELTEEQKERIESNREKAKALRKKRIHEKPYARPSTNSDNPGLAKHSSPRKFPPTPNHVTPTPPTGSQWDTYGGYILDNDEQTHSYSGNTVEEEGRN